MEKSNLKTQRSKINNIIKVENLKKIYPGRVPTPALKGVSFDVKAGEFIAIMGRSGSGKSTLLHQLGLIDTPTEGQILINDTDVLKLSDSGKTLYRLQNLGYVFQEYALIAELTALENVYLPAFALGGNNDGYKKRAQEMLEIVGLGERVDHYPNELSGGEQQRVAIARALINKPKILFADEPCANLDSVSSKVVLELFKKLNKELGQTIVMVTHEPEDEKFVDRVIWMRDGLSESP
ncbi:MAG: ABC transporter ATP-binding protein [Patescibacteria group bacterium]|nr:ABC transporter ATP-binding protein [Patescibacteria group bacterium]